MQVKQRYELRVSGELDQFENEISDLAFLWEATGGAIDQAGLFEATGPSGRYEVKASATYRDSARSASQRETTCRAALGTV